MSKRGETAFGAPSASAGVFTDGAFRASPEGKLLLDYLQNEFGVPIEVRQIEQRSDQPSSSTKGYFMVPGADQSGYGGSADPNRRVVYLNSEAPDVHVLAHEGAHAYDPSLPKMVKDEAFLGDRSNSVAGFTYGREVEPGMRPDYLKAFMGTSPAHTRLTSEALAQRDAAKSLEAVGVANPGLNDPWYREYPGRHVDASLDKAYALMANPFTPGTPMRDAYIYKTFDTPNMYEAPGGLSQRVVDANTLIDMRDKSAQNYLELGLDPGLGTETNKVKARAEAYLDRMLPTAKKSDYVFNDDMFLKF